MSTNRRTLAVLIATLAILLACASPCVAQSIFGRVLDSNGVAVPNVRVVVRSAADTTAGPKRTAMTDGLGDYRIALGIGGRFSVSVERAGRPPEATRSVDVGSKDVQVHLVVAGAPVSLQSIGVSAHGDFSCVPLDSPRQSLRVRDAVNAALASIRARRAMQREYSYQAHLVYDAYDIRHKRFRGARDIQQRPDSLHIGEGDSVGGHRRALGPVDTADEVDWSVFSLENTLLASSLTTSAFCFDTTVMRRDNGAVEVRYRSVTMPTRRGTLRVSADGLVAEAVENWGPDLEFGTSYTHIAVDGKKYPFISRTTRTLDSPYATKESDVLLFSYSGFSRMR